MLGLSDLPPEIIARIFDHLDNEDAFATRLVSHYIEDACLPSFGRRFFRKKGFMITTPSLDVLNCISQHESIRKYVQHVWFNPDCYPFRWDKTVVGNESGDEDASDAEQRRSRRAAFNACHYDHQRLVLSSGKLQARLKVAFARLPNLKVVGMRRSQDHRPWGWGRLRDATGADPRTLGARWRMASGTSSMRAPTMLFIALVKASAAVKVTLERVYTDAVFLDSNRRVKVGQDEMNMALRDLIYLEINASSPALDKGGQEEPSDEFGTGLVRVLRAVPQLRELALQIFPTVDPRDRWDRRVIDPTWVAEYELPSEQRWPRSYAYRAFGYLANGNVTLAHLTRVKLEKLVMSPDALTAFLEPARAGLTSVKLREIRLLSSASSDPFPRFWRVWRHVFAFFRDRCPVLSYVLFHSLLYTNGAITFVQESTAPTAASPEATSSPGNDPNDDEGGVEAGGTFVPYHHITREARGRDVVHEMLTEVADRHWYHTGGYSSYVMDDAAWHTDTSDEE